MNLTPAQVRAKVASHKENIAILEHMLWVRQQHGDVEFRDKQIQEQQAIIDQAQEVIDKINDRFDKSAAEQKRIGGELKYQKRCLRNLQSSKLIAKFQAIARELEALKSEETDDVKDD
jgi:hypothetical protein